MDIAAKNINACLAEPNILILLHLWIAIKTKSSVISIARYSYLILYQLPIPMKLTPVIIRAIPSHLYLFISSPRNLTLKMLTHT